jgi:hypothetical protein
MGPGGLERAAGRGAREKPRAGDVWLADPGASRMPGRRLPTAGHGYWMDGGGRRQTKSTGPAWSAAGPGRSIYPAAKGTPPGNCIRPRGSRGAKGAGEGARETSNPTQVATGWG